MLTYYTCYAHYLLPLDTCKMGHANPQEVSVEGHGDGGREGNVGSLMVVLPRFVGRRCEAFQNPNSDASSEKDDTLPFFWCPLLLVPSSGAAQLS
jgi:hypothetical protein